jgi:hypothetical protein
MDGFVAVLSNDEDGETGPVRDGLLAIQAGRNPGWPKLWTEVQLDEANLNESVGTFKFAPTLAMKISPL